MLFILKKLIAALALPPVGLLLLAAGGLLLIRRRPGTGRTLAGLSLAVLLLISVPVVSDTALRSLEIYPALAAGRPLEADVIVVLAGGTNYQAPEYGGDTVSALSLVRCRYGARLARETGLPVLVTGGSVYGGRAEARSMAAVLTDEFGVPVRFIEDASRDTRENAVLSARLLKAAGFTRVALVSHAFHLRRAVPLFEAEGLTVVPAPTAFTTEMPSAWERWLPSALALRHMNWFCHEWLGRLVA